MRLHRAPSIAAVESVLAEFVAARAAQASITAPAFAALWRRIGTAIEGGKRIRPRLVLMADAALGGRGGDDVAITAAAFELLHTALLLHDDTLDGDLVRRGQVNLQGAFAADALDADLSAHAATAWGDAAGILAGDLLISGVHALIASALSPHALGLHALVDECLFTTAAGELTDIGLALGTVAPSTSQITRMMQHKTAAYSFAAPLRAGAMLAGADAGVDAQLARIGSELGFVYQLCDDLLGVFGDEAMLGKSVDSDLREGKRTLLIAFAEHTPEWNTVAHLFGARSIDSADVRRLREALHASGARERAESLLQRRTARLHERIAQSGLPQRLCDELLAMASHCAERVS